LFAGVVDVVMCSQFFYWMEVELMFVEVVWILWSGGVFVVYDYDWPLVVYWEVEVAFEELLVWVGWLRSGL